MPISLTPAAATDPAPVTAPAPTPAPPRTLVIMPRPTP